MEMMHNLPCLQIKRLWLVQWDTREASSMLLKYNWIHILQYYRYSIIFYNPLFGHTFLDFHMWARFKSSPSYALFDLAFILLAPFWTSNNIRYDHTEFAHKPLNFEYLKWTVKVFLFLFLWLDWMSGSLLVGQIYLHRDWSCGAMWDETSSFLMVAVKLGPVVTRHGLVYITRDWLQVG